MRGLIVVAVATAFFLTQGGVAATERLCRVEVVDAESGWPVPLVELRTLHHQRFISDNAGVIALDLPECFDREIFFTVSSDGYEVPADGFGYRGVRVTPRSGQTLTVKVNRTSIAKRLGRLTGSGLFAEAQRFGDHGDWREGPLMGCDSVQMTLYDRRPFWSWGDTLFPNYPLGNFNMTGATTGHAPVTQLKPPIFPHYDYFLSDSGGTKGIAPIAGKGPTWLSGYASLADAQGEEHLVALYRKIEPPLTTYEIGLCQWDPQQQIFAPVKKLWSKSDGKTEPTLLPGGHTLRWREPCADPTTHSDQREWLLMGDPLPRFRCPATYEAWSDPDQWQEVTAQVDLADAHTSSRIKPHSGSIAWSPRRERCVTVFMQSFGKPSAFGELWYAEAKSPLGPWGPAVKILSHLNYTFYNPRLWGEFADPTSDVILFEGTYTEQFAKSPPPTARYDYNQILYRIDLNDPKLDPARALLRAD